jgi:hypothetical protein
MFVDQSDNLIVGLNNMCVFEYNKFKANQLPGLDHLIEVFFNVVFFHGDLTDFDADVNIFHKSHIEDFGESEILIGENFKANFLGDLGPVSLSETLFPQSGKKWDFRSELVNLGLNTLCDFEDVHDLFFLKVSNGMVEIFY